MRPILMPLQRSYRWGEGKQAKRPLKVSSSQESSPGVIPLNESRELFGPKVPKITRSWGNMDHYPCAETAWTGNPKALSFPLSFVLPCSLFVLALSLYRSPPSDPVTNLCPSSPVSLLTSPVFISLFFSLLLLIFSSSLFRQRTVKVR